MKLSQFMVGMILYIENPNESLQKTIRTNKEFSMIAGRNINIQKLTVFLSSNNELSENEN